ncbi:cytochrome P450 [Plenodomus tracheiphilus IPT5]|uniref:Cytochrome P450 n=1 Tax=Plenodomus tracheiphilus IPT5 TaxID=1408161 RepID=A0A6A7BJ93_9PLEO|nr:cytochrome P450 [Plenodomus tracheiphilus IPT5]
MDTTTKLNAFFTSTPLLLTTIALAATYSLYLWLLPKPIPGIPFNPEAARSLFGDVPSMLHHLKTSKTLSDWIESHHKRHNSPIIQMWVGVFQKQWVVIDDFREAQDILMRRTKEFDKPDVISDIFWGIAPNFHAVHVTNDSWRSQRKSVSDLMTPAFLNTVAAPALHESFSDLITLWKEKMRLANGHAFSIKHDVYEVALEAIWAAIFGSAMDTATQKTAEQLALKESVEVPADADEAVVFDRVPAEAVFEAVLRLTDSIESTVKSPWPILTGFLQRYYPSLRRHAKVKDRVLAEQIRLAEKRLGGKSEEGREDVVTNGVDHILRREQMAAVKEERLPDYYSSAIKDDLFGLLIAAHDTTSTTILWTLKLLSQHQTTQSHLRNTLHTAFPNTHNNPPSASEIAKTTLHYLDAVIEECIRHSKTANMPSRTTTRDAVVLGHVIPRGVRVISCSNSGGVLVPPYEIPDTLRSPMYRSAAGGKTRSWDIKSISKFDPSRWLVRDEEGREVFDPVAGPQLQFGAGQRGCYGRKMAYLELRIAVVLLIWTFEFKGVPEGLSGWGAVEMLTSSPEMAFVRLEEVS